MWDVLSALIPPAVVAAVFCTFIYKLLRKEMAPRTSDGRLVSEADTGTARDPEAASANTASGGAGVVSEEDTEDAATQPSESAIPEVPERGTDPEKR